MNNQPKKDFLWLHLKDLPYFRALLRAVESSFYPELPLPGPVLDVGCGDGHFAEVTFDQKIDVGLDPWGPPIREAQSRDMYHLLVQADGGQMPFQDGHFASAFSNSVLEHIENLQATLDETGRVLKPGAPFIFCVPNPGYYSELSAAAMLRKFKLERLARVYVDWFGRMSRTYNADAPEVWEGRLNQAGFKLERWWHYFSPAALHTLEWGHFFGLPSLVARKLTGKWIISSTRWNLALTERYIRRYSKAEEIPNGTYSFFIARKV